MPRKTRERVPDAAALRCHRQIRRRYDRFQQSFVKLDKLVGTRRRPCPARRRRPTSSKNRIERVLREDVLDVGDEQFLMLLFMMHAEDENRLDFIEQTFVGI